MVIQLNGEAKEVLSIKTPGKKVSDMTIDELKSVIHDVISKNIETWRETFKMMSDKNLMKQIRLADTDWASGDKDFYVS